MEGLARLAVRAVRKKGVAFHPRRWEKVYFEWLEQIRDWCISRQLWWGHRIPIWYCQGSKNSKSGIQDNHFVSPTKPARCPICKTCNPKQDEDVLDTWFSSALWPFATLGWPHATSGGDDLKKFYPTSVLITAFDILFFWVARMIMMGLKFMEDAPFRDVYIHAIIRDSSGQKMSKSKGNVIDPLIMIDKHGTDAFRFTLCAFAAQGRDIRFSEERVEGYRHFVNKLWNATRFIMMNIKTDEVNSPIHSPRLSSATDSPPAELDLASRWILSRLAGTADEINAALEEYRFNDAANSIYHFIWHEFCDWYIEMSKTEISNPGATAGVMQCLLYTLETSLKLLHPFMPFVTEEIWQNMPFAGNEPRSAGPGKPGLCRKSIVISDYPQSLPRDLQAETEISYVIEAITGIRTVRGEVNIGSSVEVTVLIKAFSGEVSDILRANLHYIKKLSRTADVTIGEDIKKPADSAVCVKDFMEVYIPIKGLLNIDAEIDKLIKESRKVEEAMAFIDRKLMNEDFLKKAPDEVVEKEKAKRSELAAKKERIKENINKFKAAGSA